MLDNLILMIGGIVYSKNIFFYIIKFIFLINRMAFMQTKNTG